MSIANTNDDDMGLFRSLPLVAEVARAGFRTTGLANDPLDTYDSLPGLSGNRSKGHGL